MVLVIAGHVLGIKQFADITECQVIHDWIYIFHMPLFIFISDYFSHKKNIRGLFASIWKLLEPLILFHVVMRFLEIITKGSISFRDILTPWWVLWYLLSLIYWRLLLQIIPDRFLNNTLLVIIFTFSVSIIGGFLPFDRFLSIQRTLSFMPFFFLGYCVRDRGLFLPNKYKPLCMIFLIMTFIIPLFFPHSLIGLNQASPYDSLFGMISRVFVFCLSVPMSIAFINLCPTTLWSAKQGRFTMQYYIYHALLIYLIMSILSKINLPYSLLTATICTIIITIGIGISSYIPYFDKFTNPSSFFKKKTVEVTN